MLSLAYSQIATATNAIWLKDTNGVVCTNSASSNSGQLVGLGDAASGSVTIDNPGTGTTNCTGIPTTTSPITFSGFAQNTVPISMIKPGTNNNPECLNQGSNLSGVNGSATTSGFTLTFAFSYTNGCPAPLPVFTRTATLTDGSTVFNGTYYVYNTNTVPEPSTIMLLLAGLLGLAGMSWLKRSGRMSPPQY
ncbi:PEP-CTERM sorting domain-containing protein [Sulfurirhabdus autotrophica]|nr:PEP-CTERM sorting domain-containing protein [Sulfurirhabdus autotrophica]